MSPHLLKGKLTMNWSLTRLWLPLLLITFFSSNAPSAQAQQATPKSETQTNRGKAEDKLTIECRRSIDKGTKYLLASIQRSGVPLDPEQQPDLSCTAIVGLALMSQGNSISGGPHIRELRRILDAILSRVEELPDVMKYRMSDSLVQRKIGVQADLFLTALFLTQVLSDPGPYAADVRRSLEKIVGIIARSQQEDGTWGEESWAPVLGTVLGWESLRAASSCGFKIDASAEKAGEALLKKLKQVANREEHWMHNLYKDASGVRVLGSLGMRKDPAFQACVDRIVHVAKTDDRPFIYAGGEEYLSFYLATECLIQDPQDNWRAWYPTVRDKLIRVQNRDGSWSGHHCITSRTFCTAAALLALQAPYKLLPISDF